MYKLSNNSANRLIGVHPLMVSCVCVALKIYSKIDFGVASGCVRTIEQQKEYVAKGVSKTLKSKHLIQPDGFSHAVDLYPSGFGTIKSIPYNAWREQYLAMKAASKELGLVLEYGFEWGWDKPHFGLLKIL